MKFPRPFFFVARLVLLLVVCLPPKLYAQTNDRQSIVEVTGAVVQEDPAQLTLSWEAPSTNGTTESYSVFRRETDFDSPTLWRSTDSGATWAPLANTPIKDFHAIHYANGIWVAGGASGELYTSPDGANWTKKTLTYYNSSQDLGGEYKTITGIANNGSTWLVTATRFSQATGTGTNVYRSTDNGATFTQVEPWFSGNCRAVAYGNGRWIVAGGWINEPQTTATSQAIHYSSTGADNTWTKIDLPAILVGKNSWNQDVYRFPFLYDIAHQGGSSNNWVAVGEKGDLYTSTNNGGAWTKRTSGTTKTLKSIIYANSLWVAVGESTSQTQDTAVILTSTNMTDWTARSSGVNQSLNKVFHDGSKFIAIGDGGTRIHSTDGITWTVQNTIGTKSLSSFARNDTTWIAAFSQGWGTPLGAALPPTPRSFTDSTLQVGKPYEYMVERLQYSDSVLALDGKQYSKFYGLTLAGVNLPLIEDRGRVIIVVDTTTAAALPNELELFKQNLVGDGHEVTTLTVAPVDANPVNNKDAAPAVRTAITNAWQQDPERTKSVILLGNVPYAYSGTIAADGHTDHRGAWTSDGYYGTPLGEWTDSVANMTAGANALGNVPGDGYFDQDALPTTLQMAVGRVRMDNLPLFSETPTELVKRYLDKNNAFRKKHFTYQERGLINSGFVGQFGLEASVWKAVMSSASLFGSQAQGGAVYSSSGGDFGASLSSGSFLSAFANGPGTDTSVGGAALSVGFTNSRWAVPFMGMWGSYFGDYHKSNNLLRSALAQRDHIVATYYGNSSHDYIYPMGMGLTLGDVWRKWGGAMGRQYAILGDPTLRLHMLAPATGGSINSSNQLSWTASTDSPDGYYVYRSASKLGTYTRLTPDLITGTSWTDPAPLPGESFYQVRAIKKYNARAGSYWNNSQGLFFARSATPPAAPSGFTVSGITGSSVQLTWTDNSTNESNFTIERRANGGAWTTVALVPMDNTSFTDTTVSGSVTYEYRIRTTNNAGTSDWVSLSASFTTPPVTPSNLGATVTPTSVELAWTDNATTETGYEIARKTASGAWATRVINPANTTAFSDGQIMWNVPFSYRVRALGSVNSPWSNEVKAMPPWTFREFRNPSIAGDFDSDTQTYTLKSSGTRFNFGSESATFLHQPAPASGEFVARLNGWSNTTSSSRFGIMLRNGTAIDSFNVAVLATNGSDGLYQSSRVTAGSTAVAGKITTPALPNLWVKIVWGGGTATTHYSTNGSSWTQIGGSINISTWNAGLQIGLAGASYDAATLSNFTFREVALTTPVPAGSPAAASAPTVGSPTGSSLIINWTDNSNDETGFKIQRSTSPLGPFVTVATTAANATSFTDTGLASGTFYYYRIVATNASGDSLPTGFASATTTPSAESLGAAAIYEPFNYPIGTLTASGIPGGTSASGPVANGVGLNGNWTMMKNATTNLSGSEASFSNLEFNNLTAMGNHLAWQPVSSSAANYLTVPLSTAATSALQVNSGETKTLWGSFVLRTDATNLNGSASVELRNGTDEAHIFGLRAYLSPSPAILLLVNNSSPQQLYAFQPGKTYLLIARTTISRSGSTTTFQSGSIWVLEDTATIPFDESGLGTPTREWTGPANTTNDRVPTFLRVSNGHSTAANRFDEIRFGTSFSQVAPVTPPPAPFGFTATRLTSTSVALSWLDTSTFEQNFVVERSQDGSTWSALATLPANTVSYTDSAAPTGDVYYRVRATNPSGSSAWVQALISAPPAPSGFGVADQTASALTLTWTDLPDEDTYRLEVSPNGVDSWTVLQAALPADTTSYLDAPLNAGTTRHYRLAATNINGTSPWATTSGTTPAVGNYWITFATSPIPENAGSVAATLHRIGSTAQAATVTLSSTDARLVFPASVTIPAGQASVGFTVTLTNDGQPNSSAYAPITITVPHTSVVERFDYPTLAETLDGKSGGTGWAGAWTSASSQVVVGEGLTYTKNGTIGSAENRSARFNTTGGASAIRTLQNPVSSGNVWISFLHGRNSTNWDTGVHLRAASGANWLYIRYENSTDKWAVEQRNADGSVKDKSTILNNDATNATHFFVVNLNFDAGMIHVWMNPEVSGNSPTNAAGSVSYTMTAGANKVLGQFRMFGYSALDRIDEIRVASSFAGLYGPGDVIQGSYLLVTDATEYTVTFDANGGSAPSPASKQVTPSTPYGTLATTTRSGFALAGWFTAPTGGTQVTAETVVATSADHTLYAQWTALVPELDVSRSATPIAVGTTENFLGWPITVATPLTYTLSNTGTAPVTLSTPVIGSTTNADVTMTTQPASTIEPGQSTSLVLEVTPTMIGPWSFTVSIASNDANENPYTWSISGISAPASAPAVWVVFNPGSVSEGAGTISGTVHRLGSTAEILTVQLSSPDARLTLPGLVTIAAGQSSASFTATVGNDAIVNPSNQAVVTIVVPSASVVESFDYPTLAETLDGKSGGTGWAGAWASASSQVVVGEGLTYTKNGTIGSTETRSARFNNGSEASALRSLQTPVSSGNVWVSFLYGRFSTAWSSGLMIRSHTGANWLRFYYLNSTSKWVLEQRDGSNAVIHTPTILNADAANSTLFVVLNLDFTSGTVTAWVNPDVSGSTPANAAGSVTFPMSAGGNKVLGQIRPLAYSTADRVDEIRVASSFAGLYTPGATHTGSFLVINDDEALSPLQTWRQTHFGTTAATGNAANTADPDGDGLANLVEYALGGHPLQPGSVPRPTAGVSGNRITLGFTPQVLAGLSYIVEASSNLTDWSEATDVTHLLVVGQAFTHTDSVDLAPGSPRRFLRLRIQQAP